MKLLVCIKQVPDMESKFKANGLQLQTGFVFVKLSIMRISPHWMMVQHQMPSNLVKSSCF